MKKVTSFIITILIVLFSVAVPISAASGVWVEQLGQTVKVGQTVTLSVTLEATSTMNAFEYVICYDASKLSFIDVSTGVYNNQSGKVYYVNTGNANIDIADFRFKVLNGGDITVNITDIFSANDQEYSYDDCSFTFSADFSSVGDINLDGLVNTVDLALLKTYLAENGSAIDNADINNDGNIDTTDLALLKQNLAEG